MRRAVREVSANEAATSVDDGDVTPFRCADWAGHIRRQSHSQLNVAVYVESLPGLSVPDLRHARTLPSELADGPVVDDLECSKQANALHNACSE